MSNLVNQPISSTFGNLLTLNTPDYTGLDLVLRSVGDGFGIESPLQLSTEAVNINYSVGSLFLNGIALTATASSINSVAQPNPILQGTAGVVIPSGTTAQRPDPAEIGRFRLNIDTGLLEFFNGTIWVNP